MTYKTYTVTWYGEGGHVFIFQHCRHETYSEAERCRENGLEVMKRSEFAPGEVLELIFDENDEINLPNMHAYVKIIDPTKTLFKYLEASIISGPELDGENPTLN